MTAFTGGSLDGSRKAFTLAETQSCHPELVSGSHETNAKEEILNSVLSTSKHNDPCFRMTRCACKKKVAFTLAETMIVLVILGIVAAITIPALVRRHVESSNRTKIRKAMAVYDTAINKMVVENGIKSNDALINEFNADKNNNSCAKSRAYFKVSQDGANDCTFRASDGVWWNISDINHPIIAFNEDDLTDEIASGDTNKAFKLVGYMDGTGILRVGDLGVATDDNKTALSKLYNFVNNVKSSDNNEKICDSYCEYKSGNFSEKCTDGNKIGSNFDPNKDYYSVYKSCTYEWGDELHIFNDKGQEIAFTLSDGSYPSFYYYDDNGQLMYEKSCEDVNCEVYTYNVYSYENRQDGLVKQTVRYECSNYNGTNCDRDDVDVAYLDSSGRYIMDGSNQWIYDDSGNLLYKLDCGYSDAGGYCGNCQPGPDYNSDVCLSIHDGYAFRSPYSKL